MSERTEEMEGSKPILRAHPEFRLGRYFTDGRRLAQVRSIGPLGSVEFEDSDGRVFEVGCCAAARRWRPVERESAHA